MLRRRALALLLLAALPAAPCGAWTGAVVAVHDGDTLTVQRLDGGGTRRVRVYGVDCPELGQPGGDAARELTTRLLTGKTVEVIPARARSYRREVAGVVLLEDMLVLQEALVSAGLAWVDGRYCRLAVCAHWQRHEADARAARRGLWAEEDPAPPWQWRRLRRKR